MLRCVTDIRMLIPLFSLLLIFHKPSFTYALTINYDIDFSNTGIISSIEDEFISIRAPSTLRTVSKFSSSALSTLSSATRASEQTLGALSSLPPVPIYPTLDGNNTNNNDSTGYCSNWTDEDLPPDSKPFLSDLLLQNVLDEFPDACNATILGNGFINLINNVFNATDDDNSTTIVRNATLTFPSLLIQCSNDTISDRPYHATRNNFTKFLVDIANNYTSARVIDDSAAMVYKDNFTDSVLIIIFSQTALCIAAWMVFLVLLLLPSNNYNNRNIFVHVYVLFYALVQSIFLSKAYNGTFKFQYTTCIQDASKYEKQIVDLTSYKICEIFINILSNINWLYIVIFMYQVDVSRNTAGDNNINVITPNLSKSQRKNIFLIIKKWIFNSKYPQLAYIIFIGTTLIVVNNTFFVIILWNQTRLSCRIVYKATELLMYTLLIWRVGSFILRNFGITIASTKQLDSLNGDKNSILNQQNSIIEPHDKLKTSKIKWKIFKKWISNIWKDYYDTVPLLIYNIVVFILSYFMIIYFTAQHYYVYRWKYNLVYFTKLLITVNFWGLIGVFRRREIFLNKRTIIGRKINNKDKFFIDPTVNYDLNRPPTQFTDDRSGVHSNNIRSTTPFDNSKSSSSSSPSPSKFVSKFSIPKPLHSLTSKFNTSKQRRTRFHVENKEQENSSASDNNNYNDRHNVQGVRHNNSDSTQTILFGYNNDDTSMKYDLLSHNVSYDDSSMEIHSHRNYSNDNDRNISNSGSGSNGQDVNVNNHGDNDSEDTELESNYIFNTS